MEVIFTNMRSFKLKTLIILLSVLIPPIVFAVNITVPQAPGAGYFLFSTSTGAYVWHSSSTAATDFGITSSQWTTTSTGIYYTGGNVGIGTTTPTHKLSIWNAGTNGFFAISSSTSGDILNVDSSGNVVFGGYIEPSNIYFMAPTSEIGSAGGGAFRLVFTSSTIGTSGSGRFGIGTSSPATTLDVNGSSTFRGNIYTPALGSSGCLSLTTNGLVATSSCLTSNTGDWAGTWQTHSPSYFQTALGFTPLNPANNLSELTSTSTARTNLGLGSIATQNSNAVAITGGNILATNVTSTNLWITSVTSSILAADANGKIIATTTSGGVPAGSSGQLQYNNNGAFGADNDFSYNSSTKNLTLTNVSSSLRIGKSSNFGLSQTSTMVTYNYTGATSSFIVPSTVSSITISATGGGGSGSTSGEGGGQAGQVTGTLSVVAGETIYFFVGGEGSTTSPGLPGGGSGYSGAGGGGGFTWVSTSSSLSTSTVILVAAGGGGGGLHSTSGVGGGGGLGGGLSGTAGGNGSTGSAGGGPGTQINGGAPGSQNAATGTIFEGGSGESRSTASGGGGGGGWYGGGGGGSDGITGGGGGGGSSYLSPLLTNTSTATGTASTPGNLTFTYYSGSFYQLPNVSIGQHIITGGVGTTTVSSCGTSPSIVGNDTAGVVTTGSGTVTSCVVNFGSSWPNPPVCIVSDNLTSITPDISSTTLTSVTFGFSSTLTSGKVYYQCLGY